MDAEYFYVARSKKKPGMLFKFEQYADDGYGKYEATVSQREFVRGTDMPATFDCYKVEVDKKHYVEFVDHDVEKDVEFVKVTVTFG